MPIITHALLYIGYAMISLTIGLTLNQVGGDWTAYVLKSNFFEAYYLVD